MVSVFRLSETDLVEPRRIIKYVLIWCRQGSLIVQIDGHDFKLAKHETITITSGQIHFIKESNGAEGYVLEFTYDFFCKDDKDVELIFENGLFCHFDENQVIAISNFKEVAEQLRLIDQELKEEPYQYLTSVHSRIELILVEINRSKINRGDEIWKPDALLLKFLELVRRNFNST
ncbi:hypothetical protein SYJ56_08775 [Algoriphagus sp. D3-2-R+10]|uniref:hypothetical protein n=1 Tax=Algoriphagus aurantiacus TaxID=3103948 RepID=UPI002B3F6C12|nr:hypothetical protein [Algoriphagus sp. D3-2-R+10]MEB2775399.1 hypothetical protein [Algoriphagus sp. D3-2-R+10]